jgi:DNA-binding winged helix-turn-helix (wHTH) protein/tetratricopeptide (TPR) repeat protein
MISLHSTLYEFGPFLLDVVEHRLLRAGRPIHLTPKLFDLLLLLVRENQRIVRKDELMVNLWPDSFVEENNLTVCISILRRVLGESLSGRQYIVTVPRVGYKFIAQVKEVMRSGLKSASTAERVGPEPDAAQLEVGSDRPEVTSLAVLPFENETSALEIEYISDELTHEIINTLSQLPRLSVVSGSFVFRYKGQDVDARQVGQELNVEAVLLGRILQYKDGLLISLELVDVLDGAQLWGKRYDCQQSNISDMQVQISRDISGQLKLGLSSGHQERLVHRHTENTKAYQLYLKGRYFWKKYAFKELKKSLQCFSEALELDPGYSLAYAGLADSYYRLSRTYLPPREVLPKAKSAAIRAVEIDGTIAEAHLSLSNIRLYYDHDWDGAERECRHALDLKPTSAIAHQYLSSFLTFMGRFEEAVTHINLAEELDPLSIQSMVSASFKFYLMRRYDLAIKWIERVLEIEPDYVPGRYFLGVIYIQQGNLREAVEILQGVRQVEEASVFLGYLGYAYALLGETREAEQILLELKEMARHKYVTPYCMSIICVGLGDDEQVIEWLEKLYEERDEHLVTLKVSPEFDVLRDKPRFADLMRRVGFISATS